MAVFLEDLSLGVHQDGIFIYLSYSVNYVYWYYCSCTFVAFYLFQIALQIAVRSVYFDTSILFLAVLFHRSITFYFSALLMRLQHERFIS